MESGMLRARIVHRAWKEARVATGPLSRGLVLHLLPEVLNVLSKTAEGRTAFEAKGQQERHKQKDSPTHSHPCAPPHREGRQRIRLFGDASAISRSNRNSPGVNVKLEQSGLTWAGHYVLSGIIKRREGQTAKPH